MSYKKYKNLTPHTGEYQNKDGSTALSEVKESTELYLVPSVKSKEDKHSITTNNKIVVVDIYGEWCGPCKKCEPEYSEFARKYTRPGKCMIVKEDIDNNFTDDVQGVPMFQFFINGKLDGVITGANMKAVENKILDLIQS